MGDTKSTGRTLRRSSKSNVDKGVEIPLIKGTQDTPQGDAAATSAPVAAAATTTTGSPEQARILKKPPPAISRQMTHHARYWSW